MSSPRTSAAPCPQHAELLALAAGTLTPSSTRRLDQHLESCPHCEATLQQLEDDSDTLIRSLASLPTTADDEVAFQQIHARLLATPESFLGSLADDPTAALAEEGAAALALPHRIGSYELLEHIGAGAHGAVFRARHLRLDKPVAIKLLLHAAGPAVDDFLNEMRAIGKLDHEHIIRASDAGEVDGIHFLVMDFVPGLDVSSLLRRVGPLPVPDACEIARQAALGLAFAHQHDLVHRDVKASNLLFTAKGQIKLLDLGLATIASHRHNVAPTAEVPRGTVDYMAPEQWRQSEAVDARADLYSLGCTLHKLLTGVPPYYEVASGFASKQRAHADAPIPSLRHRRPETPASLDQLVTSMLAKDPHDRPASAELVARQLDGFAAGSDLGQLVRRVFPGVATTPRTGSLRPPRLSRGAGRWLTRRNALVGSLAAGAAITARLFLPKPPRVATGFWRTLAPAEPQFLRLPGRQKPTLRELPSGQLELQSHDLALLHLGHPLRSVFRWVSSLSREDWSLGAGIFFRFRLEEQAPDTEYAFHTIELIEDPEQGPSLQWREYRRPPAGEKETAIVLAFVPWSPLAPAEDYTLDVTIGRLGLPQVAVNAQRVSESDWKIGREARDLMFSSPAQLRIAFLGRIGLFHQGDKTIFGTSRLTYLDA